jgi:hypothetical protein
MFTVLSNTRNANLYIISALAIMVLVLLTVGIVPSISISGPASIPVSGSQNAYAEFLSGEKVLYGNPARLSEALSAYHLGEKAVSANPVEWMRGFSTYLTGEKTIYTIEDAFSAWSSGEKTLVRPADVEAALWDHRMGEKGLK